MGNDSVSGSTGKRASDASSINTAQHPFDDSVGREKKAASPGFNMGLGSNLFTNFKKIFVPGVNVVPNDRLNRTLTYCASASVPSRELHRWVSIEAVLQNLSREILSLAVFTLSLEKSRFRARELLVYSP